MKSYRNQALRDLAQKIPFCVICGAPNKGQVVGAHSNRLIDGKGMGVKSHDLVAYVCGDCHAELDGDGDRRERHNDFLQAFYDSMLQAFLHELVVVKK
jgi:hypothetical protein